MRHKLAIWIAASLLGGAPGLSGELPESPSWAKALKLVSYGGPVKGDVEVSLNGQFVTQFQEEPSMFTEIADLVRPGLNELMVAFKTPEAPRTRTERMTLEIRNVETSESRSRTVGRALVEIVIPEDAGDDPSCQHRARFWAGPPAQAEGEPLKSHYWLFVTGPPARSQVAVFVNDRLVYEASSGNEFVEITSLVKKGKNSVVFESRPTCLVPKSGRPGLLRFSVAPAEVEAETVKMTSPPDAEFEVDPKRKGETLTVRRVFRGY